MVKSGIPVPATIPDESRAFVLCVPDSPEMMGIVMGAIKPLTFNYYWQGTEEQVAAVTARFDTMYYNYQEQVGCMICDLVTECFTTENPELMAAVAAAIANNPLLRQAISEALSENGGATPGLPITDEQAAQDTLPGNVRDEEGNCIDDALWGGMLYLVQSGNRTITDFFQILEAASNTLEASAIILQNVPAVGGYAASAASFADQMQENIAEGYAAAYTEAYEESLACEFFCRARVGCALSVDDCIEIVNARLTAPIDIGDMGEIMAGIASGTWIGDEIADVAFLVYFSALKFGQQFGDKLGIRPLTDLMSLGADQLASDNWEVLCDCEVALMAENVGILADCGAGVKSSVEFEDGVPFDIEAYEDADGGNWIVALRLPVGNWRVTLNNITGTIIDPGSAQTAYAWMDTGSTFHNVVWSVDNVLGFPADTDTTRAIFTPWCSTQDWNVMLNNGGPMTANFTAVAI